MAELSRTPRVGPVSEARTHAADVQEAAGVREVARLASHTILHALSAAYEMPLLTMVAPQGTDHLDMSPLPSWCAACVMRVLEYWPVTWNSPKHGCAAEQTRTPTGGLPSFHGLHVEPAQVGATHWTHVTTRMWLAVTGVRCA